MTSSNDSKTTSAPARADAATLAKQSAAINRSDDATRRLFAASPTVSMVLNQQLQIIHINPSLSSSLHLTIDESAIGKRPGELFGCENHPLGSDGCGTSPYCLLCGVFNTILASIEKADRLTRECSLTLRPTPSRIEMIDLRVTAEPLMLGGVPYTIVSIVDISHEKRRRVLEQVFFHDFRNVLSSLDGHLQLLKLAPENTTAANVDLLIALTETLMSELEGHELLMQAEQGLLRLQPAELDIKALVREVTTLIMSAKTTGRRPFRVSLPSTLPSLKTHKTLVKRVLWNMIKNALEASPSDAMISVGCEKVSDTAVRLWVNNPGEIPADVRGHIFHRSFSTKGPGRGLGTHSIRIFTENFLGGTAGFTTNATDGTTFYAELPLVIPNNPTS